MKCCCPASWGRSSTTWTTPVIMVEQRPSHLPIVALDCGACRWEGRGGHGHGGGEAWLTLVVARTRRAGARGVLSSAL